MIGMDAAIMMTYCSTLEKALASSQSSQIRESPSPNDQPYRGICYILSVTVTDERQKKRLMKLTRVIGP